MTNRPPDWDWVKTAGECTAAIMFGSLKTLAQRDVQTRNNQLGKERFIVGDHEGISFWVDQARREMNTHVWFTLLIELNGIRVGSRGTETIYTVRLDDTGHCKLWSEDQSFDPWQVLKRALEPLLFPGPASV